MATLIAPVIEQLSVRPYKWVAAGPMLWRDANGHEMLSAKVENGKAVQLSVSSVAPIIVLIPEPWYLDAAWLLPVALLQHGRPGAHGYPLADAMAGPLAHRREAGARRQRPARLPLEPDRRGRHHRHPGRLVRAGLHDVRGRQLRLGA